MITIKKEGEEVQYVTLEFKPISYLRTKSSSSFGPSATNVIRVSDASVSDSDSSLDTPQSHSQPSENQPSQSAQQVQEQEDTFVDIMEIDEAPILNMEHHLMQQDKVLPFNVDSSFKTTDIIVDSGNIEASINEQQFLPINDLGFGFNANWVNHSAAQEEGYGIHFSSATPSSLLCTETPETFIDLNASPTLVNQWTLHFPYKGSNPLRSPRAVEFSGLSHMFTAPSTINEVPLMHGNGQVALKETFPQMNEEPIDFHVAFEDQEYGPFMLVQFFNHFIKINGLQFIWEDIVDHLLQLRPNVQAHFANDFASWASKSSTSKDLLQGWLTKFINPDVGLGLIIDNKGKEQGWDLFQVAFNYRKVLIFIPVVAGPFLACRLDWFFSFRLYSHIIEKWALFGSVSLCQMYEAFQVFTPPTQSVKRAREEELDEEIVPCQYKKRKRLKQLTKEYRPQFVYLSETMLQLSSVANTMSNLGYDQHVGTNACEGISTQGERFIFTCVYGHPKAAQRWNLWNYLQQKSTQVTSPWIIMGDFNQVLTSSENLSRCTSLKEADQLRNLVDSTDLIDLQAQGNWYTWHNGRLGDEAVWERLDKCFCNIDWLEKFPHTNILSLASVCSDHSPLVVRMYECIPHRHRPFRFEAMWLLDDGCEKVVTDAWLINKRGSLSYMFVQKCKEVKSSLKCWNRNSFGHVQFQIKQLNEELESIQHALPTSDYPPHSLLVQENIVRRKLEDLLTKEEIMWAQKARQLWLVQGDRNTKYFHAVVKKRRVHNQFTRIKKSIGEWSSDYAEMEGLALDYFKNVYTYENKPSRSEIESLLDSLEIPVLNEHEIHQLQAPITNDEIEKALFLMKPDKAPGPDGLPPMFFQNFWPVIQQDLIASVKSIFQRGFLLKELNQTLITLIPKHQCLNNLKISGLSACAM
ncbi:ribonuclease H [Senna tora]|uniref:Ribonuclease H n=1 Tax=Senna tora TaxID=362788 RepID=A0A834W9B1_9FABA|nr:ribonuclease H [Senna tora]